MSSPAEFVHLHLHSQYSLLDGAVRLDDLFDQVKSLGMNAVAVTDHGNMFGAIDFYIRAIAKQIKPILGAEVYVARGDRRDRSQRQSDHLILLARNDEGYHNLKYLVSMGYVEGFYYRPRIDKELLAKHSAGLIGATACLGGEVAKAFTGGGYQRALEAAKSLNALFEPGHFFLEVQNNGYAGQIEYNDALRKIGQEIDLPLLASNDVHYLSPEDAKAHKVLMCIQKGLTLDDPRTQSQHYTDELYLRSADEMRGVMQHFPDAVANTLKVAEMCQEVVPTGPVSLPDFDVPAGVTLDDHLRRAAHAGLNARLEEFAAAGKVVDRAAYRKRLDGELDVICGMGYAGYFLIVHDFIGHARGEGIPVGPGRGSGAGSLVAFSLKITNLDPIPLGLLFERFLTDERVSMPDFDIDFCKDRREQVIAYVVDKYGKDNVGQIATFHALKSRSAVRDVGRVMGMSYGDVDRIARLVPEGPGVTLPSALEREPRLKELRRKDNKVDELLTYASRLENLNRHAGIHAAGVVISNKPLWEYVPVFKGGDRDQVANLVSQFDMKFVEKAGLIKFDFLGLKTLTVIDTAIKLIDQRPDRTDHLDIDQLPIDDPAVYDLISSGNTWGVFQLESRGFQELLRKLRPDCFEDIVAAVALYRPGPLEGGMVEQFIECKHGHRQISYLHPKLESILKETYGVIVYQEQVMQAAQILAGYSLGKADVMRRAMGKKDPEEMSAQRLTFVSGAEQRGIDPGKANEIFDLIDKFAGYGFNKSHSAAYAMVTFQTAWLKSHFPPEFTAALLTCDREDTEKVARYIRAARGMGVEVLPPDINRSAKEFSVLYPGGDHSQPSILFGLGAIKGVGSAALSAILEAREEGPFEDVFDFTCRVDLLKVNKAVIESLVRAGAFDSMTAHLEVNRGRIFGVLDRALEMGRSAQRDREVGQTNLFGALAPAPLPGADAPAIERAAYDDCPPWDERTLLAAEKNAIGFYMSGHPMERHGAEAARLSSCNTETVGYKLRGEKVTLAGMVMDLNERTTRAGKRLAIFALEDLQGRVEIVAYSEKLDEFGDLLRGDDPVFVAGTVRVDDRDDSETRSVILEEALPLGEVRARRTREVHLHLDASSFSRQSVAALKAELAQHPGRCNAYLEVVIPDRSVTTIDLPEEYRLAPSDELIEALDGFAGIKRVEFR
jgi:DNA polymerase-3 subunit alpha